MGSISSKPKAWMIVLVGFPIYMHILRVWLVLDSEKGGGGGAGHGTALRLSRSDGDLRDRVLYACLTVRALGRTLTFSFGWRRGWGGCAHAG
jgi:hypothetical protein